MITIISGFPGAGKTLYLTNLIAEQIINKGLEDFLNLKRELKKMSNGGMDYNLPPQHHLVFSDYPVKINRHLHSYDISGFEIGLPNPFFKTRRFCITINNPTETDDEMMSYLKNLEHIKYFIFSREKGNKEGTIHLQMFLIFTIGKRFSTIKKLFPTAHIESAKGTNSQNRDYCSKSDTHISGPFEFGEFADQGARNDLKNFFDMVNAGASDYELQCLYPKLYEKNVSKLAAFRNAKIINDYSKSLREDLIVTYIYGSTGVGKTYCIMKKYDKGSFYRITDYIKDPWQDYVDQRIVVFDEFRSQFPMVNMLNFLDIYPVSLPARFSNKITCYNRLFIISNIPPSSQYSNYKVEEPETYKAFNRRIHHVVHLTKEKCTVEKSRDIEELKSILPEEYLAKLDLSSFIYNKALENNKNAHQERIIKFEPIDDEDLPF